MKIFTYHPEGAESIDGFNKRLQDFAFSNNVTGVSQGQLDGALVLSLALAEDGIGSPLLIQPYVVPIHATQVRGLEPILGRVLADLQKINSDTQMYVPVETRMVHIQETHGEGCPRGYALFLIAIGTIEDESDD